MARRSKPLTDSEIRAAKPGTAAQRLFDGGGLFLEVGVTGLKTWRLKYRHDGRDKKTTFGAYPELTLADARSLRDRFRLELRAGVDPVERRAQEAQAAAAEERDTFERLALEWIASMRDTWSPGHLDQVRVSLANDVFPELGARPIRQITRQEILATVRAIEERGALEIAKRVTQRITCVFDFALNTGHCTDNPAVRLSKVLRKRKARHLAALSAEQLPGFLAELDALEGRRVAVLATELLLLTFVRTGELRAARWDEIDWGGALWRVPAERMKMGEPHTVPLARQSLARLTELRELTGEGALLFPGRINFREPMSENTITMLIRRLGYGGKTTGHGFRALARTVLDEELHWRPDFIEHQLAHQVRDPNGRAYNRTTHLEQRRQMMQAWADYLDQRRGETKRSRARRAA